MRIIAITGITATGKTTAGTRLSKYLKAPLISTDHIYSILAREIKHDHPEQLVYPDQWQKIKNYKQLKENALKHLCAIRIPSGYDGDVILEGFTLFFKEERDFVKRILNPKWITMFKLDIPFEKWVERQTKKYGKIPSCVDWTHLNGLFEKPKHYYSIKDTKRLRVHYAEYQRDGLTDEKWKRLKLNQDVLEGKSVVDLGCNSGRMCKYCQECGAKRILGIDRNWRFLEDTRRLGFDVKLMDLENLHEIKEKFDITLCLATAHYICEKERFIKEVARITKEMFVLEIPILEKSGLKQELRYDNFFVPTKELVLHWLNKYFKKAEIVGESISPDNSYRLIFRAFV